MLFSMNRRSSGYGAPITLGEVENIPRVVGIGVQRALQQLDVALVFVLAAAAIFVMDNGQLVELAAVCRFRRLDVFVGRTHIPPVVPVADQPFHPIVDWAFMPEKKGAGREYVAKLSLHV